MIEKWIESIFVKRVALAMASGIVAYWAAHQVPIIEHLSGFGINLTISLDREKLADTFTLLIFAAFQGLHEWAAEKWPEFGKYL